MNASVGNATVAGLPVPLLVSLKVKHTDHGLQCTIGAGIGTGTNTSIRYSDVYSFSTGDTTGLGFTSSYSRSVIFGFPGANAGFTWSSTTFLNGAVSNSFGPATVGGQPSASYVLSYTW